MSASRRIAVPAIAAHAGNLASTLVQLNCIRLMGVGAAM
jgi:hypothetical protein